MQFCRFKKITLLFVGGLLLAQFGGSACQYQPMQSTQFPDESVVGDQSLPSPLQPKDEENPAAAEADPKNTVEASAPEGTSRPSITDPVYDEAGILRSYTEKRTSLGEETTREVSHIEYDLSDPSNPRVLSLEVRSGSPETETCIHNIQYDNFKVMSYEYTDKLRGTVTEVFDMVYDLEGRVLTEYKVKTTGADGAFKVNFVKGTAYNALNGESFILPDLINKAGEKVGEKIGEDLYEEGKERLKKILEEQEQIDRWREALEACEKRKEMEADFKSANGQTKTYADALRDLEEAIRRRDCIKKALQIAQAVLNALSGNKEATEGTKAFEEAKSEVDRLQNALNDAEQQVKEAAAQLEAVRAKEVAEGKYY